MKAGQATEKIISNKEPTGTFTLKKYNSDKSATIQGVKYHIWSDNGYDETKTTSSEGKIEITGLKLGKYYYQEQETVEGYLLDDTVYSFTLKYADQNTSVVYASAEKTNDEPTGEITIEKTDKDTGNQNRIDNKSHHGDATLNGATYVLYAKNDIYNVARTIKYFSKDEAIATFAFNEYGVASIVITNTSTSAKLSISGSTLKGLPMGAYYSKETVVPVGYNQDTNVYNYVLEYENSTTPVITTSGVVENDVEDAPFEVIKVSTNTNATAEVVPNAEFTAILSKYVEFYGSFEKALEHLDEYAKDEYSIFRTGSNGHGISGELAYGEYTVRETYTPSPEINTVEDFYVFIDKESNTPIKELVENDSPFESYLKLQKQDKESGKFVTFSNATFSLYKLNEETQNWDKVQCKVKDQYFETWTTDENGIAKTETKVEAGTYKLTEIKIPNGFIELDEELIFKVNNRNSTLNYDKDWDAWITVTAKNSQPKGKLELTKEVKLKDDVDKSLIKDIDYTKISFKLVAKEDIVDYADGSIIYNAGQTIGTYNLNEEGKLVVDNLWMGKYYLQELSTIDGCVLDNTQYDVIFTQNDTTTKEYTVKLDITNDTTLVEISKNDITGESELAGAELSVIDKEGNIIDSWTSTDKAHTIEGLKVGEKYTLRENLAPLGYVKSTDVEFTVENTSEMQKVTMIDKVVEMSKVDIIGDELAGATMQVLDEEGNVVDEWVSSTEPHKIKGLEEGKSYTLHEEIAIEGYVKATDIEFDVTLDKETQHLEMIDKVVEMSKVDIAGDELEGAKIQVLDKEGNIVDEWVSGKEPHKIKNLVEGEMYTLHEEVAPEGYVVATDITFEVTADKETQHEILVNKQVAVKKTDFATGEELEGAELTITDKDGNIIDSWTSGTEEHFVTGLKEGETYTLTEVTCPYGYEQAESITFSVTNEKDTQLIEMKDMPILTDIKVVKTDKDTKEVIKDKFTFGIYEDIECSKLIKEIVANKEDGFVTFEDLRYGTFYIKEQNAPKGYQLSDKIVKVEINEKGVFVDDIKQEDTEDRVYSFEFENAKIETPQTRRYKKYNYFNCSARNINDIINSFRCK